MLKIPYLYNLLLTHWGKVSIITFVLLLSFIMSSCRFFHYGCTYATNFCDSETIGLSWLAQNMVGTECKKKESKPTPINGCNNDIRYNINASNTDVICESDSCEDVTILIKNLGSSIDFSSSDVMQVKLKGIYSITGDFIGSISLNGSFIIEHIISNSGESSSLKLRLNKDIFKQNIGLNSRENMTVTLGLEFTSSDEVCYAKQGNSISVNFSRIGKYNALCIFGACGNEQNYYGCGKMSDTSKAFERFGFVYLYDYAALRNKAIFNSKILPEFERNNSSRNILLYCGNRITTPEYKFIENNIRGIFNNIEIIRINESQLTSIGKQLLNSCLSKSSNNCLLGTESFEGIYDLNQRGSTNNIFNHKILDDINFQSNDKYSDKNIDCVIVTTSPVICS